MSLPLEDLRVVDLSTGIAGAYATKLLVDVGADVVKVEPPGGDPLRRLRRPTGASSGAPYRPGEEDGALFKFLAASKRSIAGCPEDEHVAGLIERADLVVESFAPGELDAEALAAEHPRLVVLSITPFGRTGPWCERPWTDFTLQAASGSICTRGLPGEEPFQAGGRISEWLGGTFGSVAALAAVVRARATGRGEHVDLSLLEAMIVAGTNYMSVLWQLLDAGAPTGSAQTAETPSIEPTADGWVGFCTNSRQQISDFMLLIGRPDLREDEELAQIWGRMSRFEEWNAIVHEYTTEHSTAEILEAASLLRIPVAPVNDGRGVLEHEQLVDRGVFRRSACGGFVAPRPSIRIDHEDPLAPGPAPRLDQHRDDSGWRRGVRPRAQRRAVGADTSDDLPLAGLRVLDMTAWWAGPSATHMLAALGADVIHLESVSRPDGMRMVGGMLGAKYDPWWDASAFFQGANTNKRGLTLDLTDPRGLDVAKMLIATCDGVIENFTPRVLDGLGLGWDVIHALSPATILVRMPAFGLSGPWRDRTGFAQTMEQLSGLAWITGHRDDQPRIQRGPCDPIAGMHAAHAFLVALVERERRGEGVHVECTMVEAALNVAAEVAIEYSAYGNVLARTGNRSPGAAPQGLYACADGERRAPAWLAVSVATDAQWAALAGVLGIEPGGIDVGGAVADCSTAAGRVAAHDEIDEVLGRWASCTHRDDAVAQLVAAGVPAAAAADPRAIHECVQATARGFFEEVEHPVTGRCMLPAAPFRFRSRVERWLRSPAPTLGQHNREILEGLVGMGRDEVDALERDGVIGTTLRDAPSR